MGMVLGFGGCCGQAEVYMDVDLNGEELHVDVDLDGQGGYGVVDLDGRDVYVAVDVDGEGDDWVGDLDGEDVYVCGCGFGCGRGRWGGAGSCRGWTGLGRATTSAQTRPGQLSTALHMYYTPKLAKNIETSNI